MTSDHLRHRQHGHRHRGRPEAGGATVEHIGSADTAPRSTATSSSWPSPTRRSSRSSPEYGDQFAGKIVVDITNPVNFQTFDSLTVPADGSAAAELAAALPSSRVVKAFNTTFAATLAAKSVGPRPDDGADRRRRRRQQGHPGRGDHRRRHRCRRRRCTEPRARAGGHRLPRDHPRRRREDRLDRRFRTGPVTLTSPPEPSLPPIQLRVHSSSVH